MERVSVRLFYSSVIFAADRQPVLLTEAFVCKGIENVRRVLEKRGKQHARQ